jgi:hypothetical protein
MQSLITEHEDSKPLITIPATGHNPEPVSFASCPHNLSFLDVFFGVLHILAQAKNTLQAHPCLSHSPWEAGNLHNQGNCSAAVGTKVIAGAHYYVTTTSGHSSTTRTYRHCCTTMELMSLLEHLHNNDLGSQGNNDLQDVA